MLRFTTSGQRLAPAQRQVLADTVENHNGVVHRVADQRQDRRDHRQRNLLVRQAERADRDQRVMEHRHHSRDTIDQLEPEPQVNQHADQRVDRRQPGLPLQLLARRRAHDIHLLHAEAGVVVVRRKRVLHLGAALVVGLIGRGRLRQADDLVVADLPDGSEMRCMRAS